MNWNDMIKDLQKRAVKAANPRYIFGSKYKVKIVGNKVILKRR